MNRTIPIAILIAALGCSACGGSSSAAPPTSAGSGTPTSSATPTSSTGSTAGPTYAGPTIPNGTYRHVLTAADVVRVGYPASRTTALLGPDHRQLIVIKVAGFNWSVFDEEGGALGLGDLGTFHYRPAHRVSMVSDSVGCPGCTQLWHWSWARGGLTMRELNDVIGGTSDDPRNARLVIEHTFAKVG